MSKRIILVFILFLFIILISPYLFYIFSFDSIGTRNLIDSVESPNGEYVVKTYLHNGGATCAYNVSAEVCDKENKCSKIYNKYPEKEISVYWINNEEVSINNIILNIFKDKYTCYNCMD